MRATGANEMLILGCRRQVIISRSGVGRLVVRSIGRLVNRWDSQSAGRSEGCVHMSYS